MDLAMMATSCLYREMEVRKNFFFSLDNFFFFFFQLLAEESGNTYDLITFQFQNYVQLDATVLRSLEIFAVQNNSGGNIVENSASNNNDDADDQKSGISSRGKNVAGSSIYGLLNRCKTSIGMRKLAQWLRLPLKQKKLIGKIFFFVAKFFRQLFFFLFIFISKKLEFFFIFHRIKILIFIYLL
jgi:DNA mismatch repair ATPase MutS